MFAPRPFVIVVSTENLSSARGVCVCVFLGSLTIVVFHSNYSSNWNRRQSTDMYSTKQPSLRRPPNQRMTSLAPSSVICASKHQCALCGLATIDAVKRQQEPCEQITNFSPSDICSANEITPAWITDWCPFHIVRTGPFCCVRKFTCPECLHPRKQCIAIVTLSSWNMRWIFRYLFSPFLAASDFYVLVSRTNKKNKFNLCTMLHIGEATFMYVTCVHSEASKSINNKKNNNNQQQQQHSGNIIWHWMAVPNASAHFLHWAYVIHVRSLFEVLSFKRIMTQGHRMDFIDLLVLTVYGIGVFADLDILFSIFDTPVILHA